jgi:hypothetical protein
VEALAEVIRTRAHLDDAQPLDLFPQLILVARVEAAASSVAKIGQVARSNGAWGGTSTDGDYLGGILEGCLHPPLTERHGA